MTGRPSDKVPGVRLGVQCAWCKRVRDEAGVWRSPEGLKVPGPATTYTHAICPDCFRRESDAISKE